MDAEANATERPRVPLDLASHYSRAADFLGHDEVTVIGAGTATASPVRGLRACLAFDSRILNVPNPLRSTLSPC
jgi:hypothetical protein